MPMYTVKSGSDSKLVGHVVVVESTRTVDIDAVAVGVTTIDAPERAQPQVGPRVLYRHISQDSKNNPFIPFPLIVPNHS